MSEPSDAVLVSRCLAGDKEAFGCLVERHWSGLRRLLHSRLANPSEADDLLQEAFLQAYLTLDQLREPARFAAWVRAIALNLARMRWRADGVQPLSWETLSGKAPPADGRSSPERISERRDEGARLRRAIAALPPAERDAMQLVYLSGLSHREVAARLSTSVGAIKVRVHRGRRRLGDALGIDIGTKPAKEITMIPVTISDIVITVKGDEAWPSADALETMTDEEKRAHDALFFDRHRVVLLQEQEGARILPIWIGSYEAEMIVVHLQNRSSGRPLTFSLAKTLLDIGGMSVEKAIVSRLHEQIFYGTLIANIPTQSNGPAEVDCRPSDAINLALRLDAPLFVASEVMDQAGVQPDSFSQRGIDERPLEAEERWYSLLTREPVGTGKL